VSESERDTRDNEIYIYIYNEREIFIMRETEIKR
jgi:hypothetical protein